MRDGTSRSYFSRPSVESERRQSISGQVLEDPFTDMGQQQDRDEFEPEVLDITDEAEIVRGTKLSETKLKQLSNSDTIKFLEMQVKSLADDNWLYS
ncbi:hypothetical protein H4219_002534 [Mycoemilia scoparia]|uniref:Uncharacterized protein n=1 Tax=Mycoemilia scoparia TaxID=417184 RepID=A0A9W8A3U9_9FUNG|nr:hypothetical protein H4219_002534 [Mycoemilia scoparia]